VGFFVLVALMTIKTTIDKWLGSSAVAVSPAPILLYGSLAVLQRLLPLG
jgi:hypothetical protein